MDGQTDEQKFPCVLQDFFPFGAAALLPFTPIYNHAKGIIDHILPLGNLLGSGSKGGKVQQNKRGLNSIVCPTIHPYGSLSPISGLSVLKSALLGIKSAF